MISKVCLNEFDKIVGKDRISVIHVNDSKNERGAMKDRHENIGFGHIGFEPLNLILSIIQNSKAIPKILETPFVGSGSEEKSRHLINMKLKCLKQISFQPDKIELLKV